MTVGELISALNAFPLKAIVLTSAGPAAADDDGMIPVCPPSFVHVRGPDPSAPLAWGSYVPDQNDPRSPFPLVDAVIIRAISDPRNKAENDEDE